MKSVFLTILPQSFEDLWIPQFDEGEITVEGSDKILFFWITYLPQVVERVCIHEI
jgi:hypothetical protein